MPTRVSEPSLRERVGGRYAISWWSFACLAVLGAGATALHGPDSLQVWALLALVSTAALGTVFAVASVTVLRRRAEAPVHPWVVVAVALAAGVVRTAALLATADVVDAPLVRPWEFVLLSNLIVSPLVVVGVALLLDQVARLRDRRSALQARLVALREQQVERTDLTDAITDVAHAEVFAALEDVRSGLDVPAAEMDSEERLAMAHRLRAVVDESLRPLSHRLYDVGNRGVGGVGSRMRGPWQALRAIPVLPLAAGVVVTVILAPMVTNLASAFVMGLVTWFTLACAVRVARRSPALRHHELVVAVAALSVTSLLATLAIRAVVGSNHPLAVILMVAFAIPLIAVIVGAFGGVVRGEEVANARLTEEVSAREIDALVANRELARVSRELAEYVHGTVQAHLLTTAFTLERAVDSGDDGAIDEALRAARAALAAEPAPHAPARDLAAELDVVASLWRGFVTVTASVDRALPALPPALVADIGRIAGEGVANARKHGGARSAVVAVDAVGDDVRVAVIDDGSGPAPGVPGMGSAWLDFIARGRWALEPRDDAPGAVLEVALPLPAHVSATGGSIA